MPLEAVPALSWCGEDSLAGTLIIISDLPPLLLLCDADLASLGDTPSGIAKPPGAKLPPPSLARSLSFSVVVAYG